MKNSGNKSDATPLRQKAEEILNKKWLNYSLQLPKFEKHNIIQELGVRQIELELQNEELALTEENMQKVDLISGDLRTILETGELQVFEYAIPMPAGLCYFETRMALSNTDEIVSLVRKITKRKFADDPYLRINMVVPEERAFVAKRASEILDGKKQAPFEHHIRCKNSEISWIKNSIILHYGSNGEVVSYVGIAKDITQLKHTQ